LAAVLSEGFAALSDEYHLLSDQQRQLESKLSFAKQQVCTSFIPSLLPFMMNTLALDLKLQSGSDRHNHIILTNKPLQLFSHASIATLELTMTTVS
jgi:hypothetical protein